MMLDARTAVAKEWTGQLLGVTFVAPRSLSDEAQRERIADTEDEVARALPRLERTELLGITELARKYLRREQKTNAWPNVREILGALRAVQDEDHDSTIDWPHKNSEFIIESTAGWIRKFDEWPGYLGNPQAVAGELIERGEFTAEQLRRAGYDPDKAKSDDAS